MSETRASGQQSRIEWIDLAKGIAILLVVVGHTLGWSEQADPFKLTKGLIFTFHMPLFFVLSVMTYTLSDSGETLVRKAEKGFKHLIVPAVALFALQKLLAGLRDGIGTSARGFATEIVNTFVFASGQPVKVGGETIPAIGMIWFFVALFLGRTLYDYLHLKLSRRSLLLVCCLLSALGAGIGRLQWLPFSLDIVLVVQPFFAAGERMKRMDLKKRWLLYGSLSMAVWLAAYGAETLIERRYVMLDLAGRIYSLYPLCLFTAMAGVVFVSCLCIGLTKIRKAVRPLIFLGRNSLYFFWVHILDSHYRFVWEDTAHPLKMLVVRLAIDIGLFALLISVVYLNKRRLNEKKPGSAQAG